MLKNKILRQGTVAQYLISEHKKLFPKNQRMSDVKKKESYDGELLHDIFKVSTRELKEFCRTGKFFYRHILDFCPRALSRRTQRKHVSHL